MKHFFFTFTFLTSFGIYAQFGNVKITYKNQNDKKLKHGEVYVLTNSNDKIYLELFYGNVKTNLPKGEYSIYYQLGYLKDTINLTLKANDTLSFIRTLKQKPLVWPPPGTRAMEVDKDKPEPSSIPTPRTNPDTSRVKTLSDTSSLTIMSGIFAESGEGKTNSLKNRTVSYAYSIEKKKKMKAKEIKKMAFEKEESNTEAADNDAIDGLFVKSMTGTIDNTKKAGTLTAGEINDFSKWNLWTDINESDLEDYNKTWLIYPNKRICVQVKNQDNISVVNAKLTLIDNGIVIFSTRSDNTGKAELWANLFTDKKQHDFIIKIEFENQETLIRNPKFFKEGINFCTIESKCKTSNNVDIAFIVDATGSMGDEINYLKAELTDVIGRVKKLNNNLNINTGAVFYKDFTDDYATKIQAMSNNLKATTNFINKQSAFGGGDFPEAVDDALLTAVKYLDWRKETRAKIAFLILDAPPHQNPENLEKIKKATLAAARKGIRLVPIVGSGIDKSTEYLMRSIALATNGTYTFLTDDSGVGNPHIKPTTDDFEVEKLNDLLVRIINQFSKVADCQFSKEFENNEPISDKWNFKAAKEIKITYFPNPTKGIVKVDSDSNITELYISDISGKSIIKLDGNEENHWEFNLSNYPLGIYLIRYYDSEKDRWLGKQLILVK